MADGQRTGRISRGAGSLEKRYGTAQAAQIKHAESFELCEYGRRPSLDELQAMFPK